MKSELSHQKLGLRLAGPDRIALFCELHKAQQRRFGFPDRMEFLENSHFFKPELLNALTQSLADEDQYASLTWIDSEGGYILSIRHAGPTTVTGYQEKWVDPRNVLRFLTEISFTSGIVSPYDPGIYQDGNYRPFKPSDWEVPLGPAFFGLALRGVGHDRLVSRRVLDAGPFRVLRDESTDTTLIQFCDWHARPTTMFTQAGPGHRFFMDPQDEASRLWLYQPPEYTTPATPAYYDARDRAIHREVTGRTVSPAEMLDAVARTRAQAWDAPGPVERVCFRFAHEHEARAHLHALWLRGLECWFGRDRIDDQYHPVFERPAWVRELEAREAAGG